MKSENNVCQQLRKKETQLKEDQREAIATDRTDQYVPHKRILKP